MDEVTTGEGWAVTHLDRLGDGPGFRKIRRALGVTAFGVNGLVLPAGLSGERHFHDRQEEVYFVHCGRIEMEFGDGARQVLEPGGVARVDPATVRLVRSIGNEDAVCVIVGGAAGEGYVGRDGRRPDSEDPPTRATS
jgi:mannose-6-phosphate isomerase-like protein (cupin superfamily)